MNKHNVFNYMVGFCALAIAGFAAVRDHHHEQHTTKLDSVVSHLAPSKYSRHAWPSLTQEQTIALGEALKTSSKINNVMLYCASSDCSAIRTDFDDALQIAGFDSSFEDRPVDSESDVGLFVGPPGDTAEAAAILIRKTTGIKPIIVDVELEGKANLALIFGKKP